MKRVLGCTASFIASILLFVGLPLAGWGIKDVNGFIQHPVRLGYVIVTVLLSLWIVTSIPNSGKSRGRGPNQIQRQRLALVLIQTLSIAVAILAPYSDRREVATIRGLEFLRYVGLVLYTTGFVLMNRAAAALEKQFSTAVTIQEDHRLVTQGPYRMLRHPRYIGIIMLFLGIALVFRSVVSIVLNFLLVVVLRWRINDEETMMKQHFGSEWDEYAKRTRRLIPWVY